MRPIRCWCFAIVQYNGIALLLFLSSRLATLRRPRRRPCQGYKVSRRSTSIGFTTQRAWSTSTPPALVEHLPFSSPYHIPIPGRALLFAPLIWDESYHGPQARLKGEGRVGYSVALCRRQLFFLLLFVVVGPSVRGSCLTGSLHNTNDMSSLVQMAVYESKPTRDRYLECSSLESVTYPLCRAVMSEFSGSEVETGLT